jgi:hypothetical protein
MAALTRNDINKIIYEYDQVNFPEIAKPANKVEAAREYIQVDRFEKVLEEKFPLEIVDEIVRKKLMSVPSVRSLMIYYVGTPSLQHPRSQLASSSLCLEGASRALLEQMKIEPTKEKTELACFKQLMTLVFVAYMNRVTLPQQLEMARKIQGTSWEIQENILPQGNTLSDKLVQLKSTLLRDQGRMSRAKVELQVMLWRVQLIISRILTTYVAKAALLLGSAYCAYRSYRYLKPLTSKLVQKMGSYLFKLVEYYLGEDAHSKRNPTLKEIGVVSFGVIAVVVGIAYLAARISIFCKDRLHPVAFNMLAYPIWALAKTIENPGGTALVIGAHLYYAGEALANHVARSMDEAAATAQKKYIQEKTPSLIEKWHQLVLNQPIQA